MSEINESISTESLNFADLFSKMSGSIATSKQDDVKNKIFENLEVIEKKLLGIYEEETIIDNSNKELETDELAQKIGYKIDWSDIDMTGWQDINSDRINIENALKKLDEQEN